MSRCIRFAVVVSLALVFAQFGIVRGQDASEAGKKPSVGLQVSPATIVQTPSDDGSLAKKVSYLIGFNMMSRLKEQEPGLELKKVIEGMKAADRGMDQQAFVTGFQLMMNLKEQGDGLMKIENVIEGMNAASAGKEMGMNEQEVGVLLEAFGKIIEERQMAKVKVVADENLAKGKAFMAKNAENPEVKALDNGVQYEVLVEGTGPQPTMEDQVKLDYEGSFVDGSVFDSSINPSSGRPAAPIEMGVAQFVPGFSKALVNMKVGSKWKVVIPGEHGYGMTGRGKIGPNQTLVFEISLLEILKK